MKNERVVVRRRAKNPEIADVLPLVPSPHPELTEAADLVKKRAVRPISPLMSFVRGHYHHICLILLGLLGLLAFFDPQKFNKFFLPQYEVPHGNQDGVQGKKLYGNGIDDIYLTITITLGLTYTRYVYQVFFLGKIGRIWGIKDNMILTKFKEAGWMGIYYPISFGIGIYLVIFDGPNYWTSGESLDYCWEGVPQLPVTIIWKLYYLTQLSMWFHCLLVIHIEKKRKDYYEMLFHHISTIILVSGSWFTGYIRGGTLMMVNQDACDVFLYNMKAMTYIGGWLKRAADVLFGFFIVLWIITRQIIFTAILWSFIMVSPKIIGPILQPAWIWALFSACLVVLEVLMVTWFYMIVRLAISFIKSGGEHVEDSRSDVSYDEE